VGYHTSTRISWNARKWIGSESAIVPSISNSTALKLSPCGRGLSPVFCSADQVFHISIFHHQPRPKTMCGKEEKCIITALLFDSFIVDKQRETMPTIGWCG
jgi:hypothetical protein